MSSGQVFVIAGVVFLAGTFWESSRSEPANPAERFAEAVAPILPKEMNGLTFESATAKDNLLIVGFDVPSSAHLDSSEVSKVFAASFCRQDDLRQLFAQGGKLRVDVSIDGATPTVGSVVDSCSG